MMLEKRNLVTGLGMLLAFVAGRYLLPEPRSGFTGLPWDVVEAVQAWKGAGVRDGELAPKAPMRRRIDRLQTRPDRIPMAVVASLQVGDPVEQHQRITDHLAKIDAGNWRDVIDKFQSVSHQTGRRHDDLWNLTMVRIGQIAGAEAIEEMKRRGFEQDQVFYGWAMAYPDAARTWMETPGNTPPDKRGQYLDQLVSGMAIADPGTAMKYMATLPEDQQKSCARDLVHNLVQGNGVESASQWLDQVLDSPASDDFALWAFNEVVGIVTSTSSPDSTGPGFALEWFKRYADSGYITPEEVGLVAARYQGEYAAKGLDFLQAANNLPVLQDHLANPPGLSKVIQNIYQNDPAAIDRWLNANPTAAFHDTASEIYQELAAKDEKEQSRVEK